MTLAYFQTQRWNDHANLGRPIEQKFTTTVFLPTQQLQSPFITTIVRILSSENQKGVTTIQLSCAWHNVSMGQRSWQNVINVLPCLWHNVVKPIHWLYDIMPWTLPHSNDIMPCPQCNDVPLRTRRALLPLTLYSDSTLLVPNETSLYSDNALLALKSQQTILFFIGLSYCHTMFIRLPRVWMQG